ncbi:50S ribosomal protein L3 N(5)-glutamine methyltransferase [Rhizobium sp. S95]|uniref:50S ribosomal protein L3 N(5)-glutamine methyltransferase n=1 Tax=Ciceribacter sichuanensis TaxID=2949647 RepID=A0AAJ1F6U1_9HYPH|nr:MULTISPECIES: 50S ribosomal protein L3 N(5)-glutamine methyltransferase [unclassified Ciceribacter]MCM2399330.1 50S ribosomal protein L3 N(5)-glutamine methyltransferase [Ciceribacter sp. S95]MCO5956464.1 50S ribosomal protein L3 N(5)-glutamine methyltransferase [Ciceribacter sp. S101]
MANQDDITGELVTLRDYWRYAISRFNAADLSYGHGTTTASDDAAFLLLDSLDLPIDALDPFLDARLLPSERRLLADRIDARVRTRKPSAYLTGRSYIQGVRFHVDERVIVPRSHIGEILFAEYLNPQGSSFLPDPMAVESAVDICTGSGCLAVLAAKFLPNAAVDAVDLSADALEVAKLNLREHEVEDQVSLFEGDLFEPLAGRRYDLIITNPPYVDHAAMDGYPAEFRAEPAMAHDGGEDGLDLVRKILNEAADYLNPGGGMICEIGSGREILEEEFPHLEFVWLETAESQDAVFWITAEALGVEGLV